MQKNCYKFPTLFRAVKFRNLSFFEKIVTFNDFRQILNQFDIYTSTLNQETNVITTIFTQYRAS